MYLPAKSSIHYFINSTTKKDALVALFEVYAHPNLDIIRKQWNGQIC